MKLGLIGAGMIGGTLGRLWHRAGHEVVFGTRHPESLAPLVTELRATEHGGTDSRATAGKADMREAAGTADARAAAGSAEQAAQDAEVVLLAVPLAAIPSLASSIGPLLAGKVVIDAGNPYPQRDGDTAREARKHPEGSSGWVASHFPDARVVKAFNTVYFQTLLDKSKPGVEDGIGIPIAGDDDAALDLVAALVRDAGFTPVLAGELREGKRFEPGTKVYNTGMRASEVARELGI